MTGHIHVVGAGIAGLSTAVALTKDGMDVTVYEAAGHAGGRCRSFLDPSLGRTIDNGNHLLLSGNTDAMQYVRAVGSESRLKAYAPARFPFVDLQTGIRWSITPNEGVVPWWVFQRDRRVAGTRAWHYLSALRVAFARKKTTVTRALGRPSALFQRFWEPLAVGALNTAPDKAAVHLLWPVLRETFLRGARNCKPLIAEHGLSHALVDPAVTYLERKGMRVAKGMRLQKIELHNQRVVRLHFPNAEIAVAVGDFVVLALPPWEIQKLVPGITVPEATSPIVNVHFCAP